jgi:methyl-accepting chemotaxis protein
MSESSTTDNNADNPDTEIFDQALGAYLIHQAGLSTSEGTVKMAKFMELLMAADNMSDISEEQSDYAIEISDEVIDVSDNLEEMSGSIIEISDEVIQVSDNTNEDSENTKG